MKKALLAFLLLLLMFDAKAQYQIGQSISNYSGTNNLYFNPSNVVDSRFKFYLGLTQTSLHFSNDFITWNGGYHPFAPIVNGIPVLGSIWEIPDDQFDNNGNPAFKDEWLAQTLNGKPKNAFLQLEQRYLSAMFNFGPKTSMAIGGRVRAIGQLTDVSQPLAQFMRYGFNTDTTKPPYSNGELELNEQYSANSFNINAFAFNEFSLTLGRVVYDQNETFFKVGATGKFFIPLYGMYMRNEAVDVTVYGVDSLRMENADIEYGYVADNFFTDETSSRNPLELGRGFGMDIGFTYEYRPNYKSYRYKMNGKEKLDPSKNKYLFRVQASLNDLGSIKMANDKYIRAYKIASGANIFITPEILDTVAVLQDRYAGEYGQLIVLDSLVGRTVGFASQSNSFTWKLPANINVNVDYRLAKNFYMNALWIQSLRGKQVNGLRGFSLLALTPRYEARWFEASVPLQLTQNYKKLRIGMYLRTGPFWIGSDNFPALFTKDDINGADFYFGLSIPIHRKKEKDKDKDQVSNKYDQCRDIPGLWEFRGCPDTDGDGIQDSKDSCVLVPGLAEFNGCPDTDGDGIQDSKDECVDVPGVLAFNGCPDTDGDSIVDHLDSCPTVAGPRATNGCPDRDGDGVVDPQDSCVDIPGLASLNGCPDKDKDGIADHKDKCPETPGLPEFNGCPDTDGDGVYDLIDLCPLEKGTVENNGCPKVAERIDILEIPEEDADILQEAFDNLEFALGSANLSAGTYESLDKLIELLNKRPEYRIYIAGHTDNTGNAKKNEALSLDRANAIRYYLQRKGISPARIKTEGFGSSRPIESNDTPEGRRKNRRVEFRVIR